MKTEARKRMGRPPEGCSSEGEPEKIRQYPRISLTARPITKLTLEAIALLQQRPAWKIIEDAIRAYLAALKPEDQKAVEAVVTRSVKMALPGS